MTHTAREAALTLIERNIVGADPSLWPMFDLAIGKGIHRASRLATWERWGS